MTARETADLSFYFMNAHEGDVAMIAESLQTLGQYKPIVINLGTKTGRDNEVLVGNATLEAALQLGWTEIDCHEIDVDDETAARINLIDNRSHDRGSYKMRELALLMQYIPDLKATGYNQADLDRALKESAVLAEQSINELHHSLQSAQAAARPPEPEPSAGPPPPQPDPFQPLASGNAPGTPNSSQDLWFTLSYTVTAEQRETILAALRKQSAELGPGTTNATALAEVCRRSLL